MNKYSGFIILTICLAINIQGYAQRATQGNSKKTYTTKAITGLPTRYGGLDDESWKAVIAKLYDLRALTRKFCNLLRSIGTRSNSTFDETGRPHHLPYEADIAPVSGTDYLVFLFSVMGHFH